MRTLDGRESVNASLKNDRLTFAYLWFHNLMLSFNPKGVFVEFCKEKSSRDGVLNYFEDGIAFKENALFKRYPKSLKIRLYIDEAQLCDSLGSRIINNKLVFVYCSLGNIESKYRSALKHIFCSLYTCLMVRRALTAKNSCSWKLKKNYSININNLVLKPFPDFSLSNSKDFSSIRYYLGDWVN